MRSDTPRVDVGAHQSAKDPAPALQVPTVTTVTAAAKHTLRSIPRRWQQLNEEIKTHEALLTELTGQLVPQLVATFGVAGTPPLSCSSWPVTTSIGSAPRPRGPDSAASPPCPPPPG
jgi:hypothetical protein